MVLNSKYFIKYNVKSVPVVSSKVIPKVRKTSEGIFLDLTEPIYIQSPKISYQTDISYENEMKYNIFTQTLCALESQLLNSIIEQRDSIFNTTLQPEFIKKLFNYNRQFVIDVELHNATVIFVLKTLQLTGQEILPIWEVYKYKNTQFNLLDLLNNTEGELEVVEGELEVVEGELAEGSVENDNVIDSYYSKLEDILKS